jgi:hypothetical protein
MKTRLFIFSALMLIFCVSLSAQKKDYSKYVGYVEFGDLTPYEDGGEITEVLIEEHLLKMVAKVTSKEEPDLSDVISGIKLIKVHTFEVTEDNYESLRTKITSINESIVDDKWDRIVRTRSSREMINVFIRTSGEELIEGLVVTQVEKDREAVFVNIVGDINLETISRLGDKFGIPGIEDLNGYDDDTVKEKD